jgi:hypothetical protein
MDIYDPIYDEALINFGIFTKKEFVNATHIFVKFDNITCEPGICVIEMVVGFYSLSKTLRRECIITFRNETNIMENGVSLLSKTLKGDRVITLRNGTILVDSINIVLLLRQKNLFDELSIIIYNFI